jgi:tetratricopeptide (TPR) repeat protein
MEKSLAMMRLALAIFIVGVSYGFAQESKADPVSEQIRELNLLTGEEALFGKLRLLIKDEAGSKKLIDAGLKVLAKSKEKDDPKAKGSISSINYNGAFVLGRIAQFQKQYDSAEKFYEICREEAERVKSVRKIVNSFDSLISLYFQAGKYQLAEEICQEFMELPVEDGEGTDSILARAQFSVIEKLLQAMSKNGKFDEAKERLTKSIKKESWYHSQLLGLILREEGKLDEAADAYLETIEKIKRDRNLSKDGKDELTKTYRYLLSGLYTDDKKIEKAAEQLKMLIEKDPENPTFYNDLGYVWADHDLNLDEAEKLIRKALDLDRKRRKEEPKVDGAEEGDNSAYLDSLAWVLYKRKNYPEAKKYLLEAIKQPEGQHIEIYDHLADVQFAMGEKKEALELWNKCMELPAISKRDKELKTSIAKKLKLNGPQKN